MTLLGFAPLGSLPLSDDGVQTLRDGGGIASSAAYGVGTLRRSTGGGKYIKIRTIPAPTQRFYGKSAISTPSLSPVRMVLEPGPHFEARSVPSSAKVDHVFFNVLPYIPPEAILEMRSVIETWEYSAHAEHQIIGAELMPEPISVVELSLRETIRVSVSPVVEVEDVYAH